MKEFLKTGATEEDFIKSEKQEAARHLLLSLKKTRTSSGAHFFRAIAGIPLSSHAL